MEEGTAHPHVPACMRRVPTGMPARPQPAPPGAPAVADQVPPCMRRTAMPALRKGAEHPGDSTTCSLDFTDCSATPERRVHFGLTLRGRPPPKRLPDPVLDQVLVARAVRAKIAATEALRTHRALRPPQSPRPRTKPSWPRSSPRWRAIGTRQPPASPSIGAALKSGRTRTLGSTRPPLPTSFLSLALSSS